MKTPIFLHPANAEELRAIAAEVGAEVFRAPLRYPSETGGWQLGDANLALDLSEFLSKYRDCEITLIVAATAEAKAPSLVCGICGFALQEIGDCPRCRLIVEETAAGIRRQQEQNGAVLDEAQKILRDGDDD
ncbi:MAG: hypothetical protein E3J64_00730 [Anaerolineales bacterium]|nr:MAG: hypothetical protein E3J64_00730 [Anaerolineales bacterium]